MVTNRMTMRRDCHDKEDTMPTAKKRHRCTSGGYAIRIMVWPSWMLPTGNRLPWRPQVGGKFPGKKLPRSVNANGRRSSPAMCICCGKIFNGDGFRCTKCEVIERDKQLNQRARARKYYQGMMPRKRVT